jgi:uncharacterized membrane protein YheB (UPF0754 family)
VENFKGLLRETINGATDTLKMRIKDLEASREIQHSRHQDQQEYVQAINKRLLKNLDDCNSAVKALDAKLSSTQNLVNNLVADKMDSIKSDLENKIESVRQMLTIDGLVNPKDPQFPYQNFSKFIRDFYHQTDNKLFTMRELIS